MLNLSMLKDVGIKLVKEPPVSPPSLASYAKIPSAKLPQLHSEMTTQRFQKFRIDWDVCIKMTNLPLTQSNY